MKHWQLSLTMDLADYENAYALSLDNMLTGPEQRRNVVLLQRALCTPEIVLSTAVSLRQLADWLEREAYRLSRFEP